MRYKFYTTSEAAWAAQLNAIRSARHSILWEIYGFAGDTAGYDFIGTLAEKAAAGVTVKLILDRVGSVWLSHADRARLTNAGIEVLWWNSLLWNTHRKMLIVDERVCFIGGVNVRESFRRWRDLHAMVEGNVARSFARAFARSYIRAGGNDPAILRKARAEYWQGALPGTAKHWFLDHWPATRASVLRRYYKAALRNAKKSVMIVTPYFIPHPWFVSALRRAVARGVSVEILLPRRVDIALNEAMNHFFAVTLSPLGIRFLFLPAMNHAKVLLVDETEGMVGSHNIHARAFDFNVEGGVVFARRDMVGDLRAIIARWRAEAEPFDPATYRGKWWWKPIQWIGRLLRPIL